jgi:hypothetical protein
VLDEDAVIEDVGVPLGVGLADQDTAMAYPNDAPIPAPLTCTPLNKVTCCGRYCAPDCPSSPSKNPPALYPQVKSWPSEVTANEV